MDRTIRTAFIGCGGISATHLRSVQQIPDVKIVAFCDIVPERAERRAQENGGGAVYTDYRQMLASEELDAVHIQTPHYLHAEMTIAALEAGLYVLCEKPMAIHIEDAQAVLAADKNHKLSMVFQNRYNPATIEAKRILDSGELGAFVTARATVAWSRDAGYYASGDWRGTWAEEGGGTLINQSIHTVDLVYYLCGPFAKIKGSISTDLLQGDIEVEDNSHAVIQFAGGQLGLLHTSNNFGFTELPQILIYCEKGLLTLQGDMLTLMQDRKITVLFDQKTADTGGKACYGNSHDIQIAEFYNSIREGTPIWLDGAEGYPAVWAVLGIYESSRTDQWVTFA